MRLRIVRPLPRQLEGISLEHLAFQGSYELLAPLANLLLATGYAIPEDITSDASPQENQPSSDDSLSS